MGFRSVAVFYGSLSGIVTHLDSERILATLILSGVVKYMLPLSQYLHKMQNTMVYTWQVGAILFRLGPHHYIHSLYLEDGRGNHSNPFVNNRGQQQL